MTRPKQPIVRRVLDLIILPTPRDAIEPVMLHDEHDIKRDADVSKPELHRIPGQTAPIVLQAGIENELRDGKRAAADIQQDRIDAPAHRRLPFVVDPHLRDILHGGAHELHVADGIDLKPD